MSIGQKIKQKRTEAKMTQAQLAEALGLSTITIRQYEADKREPRYQTLEKISEVFHCDISELVDSKREARMIIDGLLDELEKRKIMRENPCSAPEYADDFVDACEELDMPGIIVKRYADFAIKRSYILQIIKEMGVELNIRNWHEMRIEYEDQEANTRISEFISDFELLDSQFRDEIKSLFENNYGLKFNQSKPENEDFNKDGE